MTRRTFLKRVSVERCQGLIDAHVGVPDPPPGEVVSVVNALGRITVGVVRAAQSNPSAHVAAMDGIAVRSADLADASDDRPKTVVVGPHVVVVDTGDALPPGCDAVVMAEDLQWSGDPVDGAEVEIAAVVAPFKHVRLAGEDVVQGEVLLARGRRVGPAEIGALLGGGVTEVRVVRPPTVLIVPTGDELVSPGSPVPPGGVPEFNSAIVSAMVCGWGAAPTVHPPVADDQAALRAVLDQGVAGFDVVVLLAGSSAGRADFTPGLIAAAGELLVHGVNVMPGKPFAFGVVEGKPVLGLPGYPVSTHVAAEAFLRRVLERLQGVSTTERPTASARLARKLASKVGHEEVVRVALGRVGEGLLASPLRRGAGVITSLSRAHGLLRVPPGAEGLEAGAQVSVELLRSRAEIEATVVLAGSHDLALSWLDDLVRRSSPFAGIAAQALGSLGGLIALSRGAAHVAGIHLLDPASGEYNLPYVRQHLPGRPVTLVTLAHREQGLMVAPGNPLGLAGVEDLACPDRRPRLANRQRGSGTRVLLDHLLTTSGLGPRQVRGYAHEELTHLAAAMAVKTGMADTALGIRAVPAELGLDFETVAWERFDLVIPDEHLELPQVSRLLVAVTSAAFKAVLNDLPGYDSKETGRRRHAETSETVEP